MRILVLGADSGSANLGVRALARGIESLTRQVWPDATVEFAMDPGGRGRSLLRDRAILREAVGFAGDIVQWLKTFDLAIDMRGGDSFTDIYGMRRLLRGTAVLELADRAGLAIAMGPQTIGPFESRTGAMLGVRAMRKSKVVLVRDDVSFDYAKSLGRTPDALTTDVVFALDRPEVARTRDVALNVSGLLWKPNPHVDSNAYRVIVRRVYRDLIDEGRSVSLFSHVVTDPLNPSVDDNDDPAVQELAREVDSEVEVFTPTSLDDVREFVASTTLVIASRMHACLNALSIGIPAIPLAYSRKFTPLLSEIGWPHSVDLRSNPAPAEAVARIAALQLDNEALAVRARADDSLAVARARLSTLAPLVRTDCT